MKKLLLSSPLFCYSPSQPCPSFADHSHYHQQNELSDNKLPVGDCWTL